MQTETSPAVGSRRPGQRRDYGRLECAQRIKAALLLAAGLNADQIAGFGPQQPGYCAAYWTPIAAELEQGLAATDELLDLLTEAPPAG